MIGCIYIFHFITAEAGKPKSVRDCVIKCQTSCSVAHIMRTVVAGGWHTSRYPTSIGWITVGMYDTERPENPNDPRF